MIISVDLAYKRFADIGIAALEWSATGRIRCEFIRLSERQLTPETFARQLDGLCSNRQVRIVLIDGPQAWKSPNNSLVHSRVCERQLNTPAKTGDPGVVKPRNYAPFVTFSVAVYDSLTRLGWERLRASGEAPCRLLVESFPHSAWRSLGLRPLGAKRKTRAAGVCAKLAELQQVAPLDLRDEPTHDELQAVVSGLAGLEIERGNWPACALVGISPHILNGTWREGFIVNPLVACIGAG